MLSVRHIALILFGILAALPARGADLLMFAAASTTNVLTATLAGFKAPGIRVRVSYASSGALARQIDAGAPAALFLSANEKWVGWLEGKGRLGPGRKAALFGNRLVLVAPAGRAPSLKIAPGFPLRAALASGRLAIADPAHVPAGLYAREALTRLGLWAGIAERTARAPSVLAALALVERGEAPLGIVYFTDAYRNRRLRIVDTFPFDSHAPIAYLLTLLDQRARGAAELFAFLQSDAARGRYREFGFEPAASPHSPAGTGSR